jgi:hypothetical protein
MALIERVRLYYRDGASDKVYEIHLTEEEEGFRVTGFNGRRGTKLVAQPKTPRPVAYRTARYIFANLEASKLNHRRTPYRVASRETPASVKETKRDSEPQNRPAVRKEEEERQGYAARFIDAIEL